MKKLKPLEYFIFSAIILGGILIDQLTKSLATAFLLPVGSVPIIDGIIGLKYVLNPGAAFGMLANHRWVFILVSTVAILALAAYLFMGKAQNKLYSISICLIISGGIGNMIDRLLLGKVVDFIDFFLVPAVFNVADTFICVGAGLLILALVIDIVKEYNAAKKKKEELNQKENEEND